MLWREIFVRSSLHGWQRLILSSLVNPAFYGRGESNVLARKGVRKGSSSSSDPCHPTSFSRRLGDFTLSLTLHPIKSDLNFFFHRSRSYRKGTDVLTFEQQMRFPESCCWRRHLACRSKASMTPSNLKSSRGLLLTAPGTVGHRAIGAFGKIGLQRGLQSVFSKIGTPQMHPLVLFCWQGQHFFSLLSEGEP